MSTNVSRDLISMESLSRLSDRIASRVMHVVLHDALFKKMQIPIVDKIDRSSLLAWKRATRKDMSALLCWTKKDIVRIHCRNVRYSRYNATHTSIHAIASFSPEHRSSHGTIMPNRIISVFSLNILVAFVSVSRW